MREYWDFTLFFFASLPILYRAYELSTLSAIVDTKHLLSPLWWLAILGVSLLYFLHAFIWNYPKRFTALSKKLPLRLLGSHPVDVFANSEILGKFWQMSCLGVYIGSAGRAAVYAAIFSAPLYCYALFALYLLVGQGLNVAMYAAIGNDGVYYGFKLGRSVPWCTSFPFNVHLRHPQYVGVVLTLLGGLAVLMTPELVSNGLVPAGLAWASMYIIMAIMEELSDNPKATVEKAARSPTKKPPSTTKGRSKSPAKLNSPRRTKLKGFKDT